jgi:hypothetical protein
LREDAVSFGKQDSHLPEQFASHVGIGTLFQRRSDLLKLLG